ncbi:MAG TPA: ABC transporter substrate-binding protein [Thermodesulfobacteriota bacterium]|nr:ABC transporter substrate-binding protein [Deltaproteobacteria bacterium]HNR13378.1 ABC transporter substrate-binding protein [Thermodesulfobacteriota bacterium]HNU70970.1 ABC transporter substrate-binding protein [Thermodesulfobacteriota bacterium]HOC38989.1 ABC transporter substrate-binding protein [Thermodesulfobacteriota bacterium]HQO77718.1 ABC transporter substrate-binding protein [Thermodesulfobacteriota bacterium]
MTARSWTIVLALAVLLLMASPGFAQGTSATQQLQEAAQEITSILDQCAKKNDFNEDCQEQIVEVADRRFDWKEMAKRSLARAWRDRTPQEQEEFTRLFRELLKSTYIKKIASYGGEKVVFEGERIEGKYAMVESSIILPRENRKVPVSYRLLQQGDRWLIYDVVIEGVSLVNNYRSQFNDILQTSSFDELLKKIEKRISDEKATSPAPGAVPKKEL